MEINKNILINNVKGLDSLIILLKKLKKPAYKIKRTF